MTTRQNDDASPADRDNLALARTRTRLANERTMLAYARTAIMLAATGGTILKLFSDSPSKVVCGLGLVLVAIAVGWIGITRYKRLSRQLA